jgi:predicted nucleotidyltransferase
MTQPKLSKLRRLFLRGVSITFLEREPILARLTQRAQQLLATHPQVREVGLFGSLVRGDYGPGSDADLLVILESDPRRFVDRIPEFLEAFGGLGIPVDVLPYTVAEIASMQDSGLVQTALAERLVLARRTE